MRPTRRRSASILHQSLGTKDLESQPGLAVLLDRIETNGVKVVIVERADRLARDLTVSEVISPNAQAGAKVITADGADLSSAADDPTLRYERHARHRVARRSRSRRCCVARRTQQGARLAWIETRPGLARIWVLIDLRHGAELLEFRGGAGHDAPRCALGYRAFWVSIKIVTRGGRPRCRSTAISPAWAN